ncbi:hypothetical protein ACEPAH_1195 [Sanghuangporus vaninii]
MNTARPRQNTSRRRRSLRAPIVSLSLNGTGATHEGRSEAFEAILETDNEAQSDDELSDEEAAESIEVEQVTPQIDDESSISAKSLPAAIGTVQEAGAEEMVDSGADLLGFFMDDAKENKFIASLINAVLSYSAQLCVPVPPSVPRKSSRELSSTLPRPKLLNEIASDSSDESDSEKESGSSTDTFDDAELLSNRPRFGAEEATRLFYQPSYPWAAVADKPIENATVISKLYEGANCEAYIKRGLLDGRTITYISRTWKLSEKWEGFFSELALYSDPDYLHPLQGDVVPKIIGVYLVEGKISIAMELPASDFWVEASDAMSGQLKSRCIAAFNKIHDRGVLHNDVELRHMLIGSSGDVTIIDFQESRAIKPIKDVSLGRASEADIRMEKRKVLFKLDYLDSRLYEVLKMKSAILAEERRRQRNTRRAFGSSTISDYESDPEDSDDVLNPPVDSETFNREWIDEPCTPRCYIVPGQSETQVKSAIQDFLMSELNRLEKDCGTEMDKKNDAEAECSSTVSVAPSVSSVAVPILPTRINLKRPRDGSDEDSSSSSSTKKRHIMEPERKVMSPISGFSSPETALPSTFSLPVKRDPDPSSFLGSGKPFVSDIHVPFEGYTESDGFILRNMYKDEDVTSLRRTWIQRLNIKRCIEEKLPYPLAELYNLVPKTLPKIIRYDRNGNVTKKRGRPLVSLGALRRAQMSPEEEMKRIEDARERREKYFRDRCEPGTGLSDTEDSAVEEPRSDANDDDIPEGPKIMSWHELQQLPRDPIYCPGSSPRSRSSSPRPPTAKPKMPTKSILRQHLTPEEKARNVEYLELKKKRECESENDGDVSSDTLRPSKRTRTDAWKSESQNLPPSDAVLGAGNRSESPAPRKRFSSCGVPMPYLSRLSSSPTAPLSASGFRPPTPTHCSDDTATMSPTGTRLFVQAASSVSAHFEDALGSSDSDKAPSCSAHPISRRGPRRSLQATPDSDARHNSRDSDKPNGSSVEKRRQSWGSRLGLHWSWPSLRK